MDTAVSSNQRIELQLGDRAVLAVRVERLKKQPDHQAWYGRSNGLQHQRSFSDSSSGLGE